MNASDLAAIRQRNADSLASLQFIQDGIAPRPSRARREPPVLEPLIPPMFNAELGVIQDDVGERELTTRGLRGWWRMAKQSTQTTNTP